MSTQVVQIFDINDCTNSMQFAKKTTTQTLEFQVLNTIGYKLNVALTILAFFGRLSVILFVFCSIRNSVFVIWKVFEFIDLVDVDTSQLV